MRVVNGRRFAISIVLIIMVIAEIIAFGISRAKNVKNIIAQIKDEDSLLALEEVELVATDSEESGYFVVLPELINGKKVDYYIIEEVSIENEVETKNKVEKKAGESLFLTTEEIENGTITLEVKYDYKEVNENTLYYKEITTKVDDVEIAVTGYLPNDVNVDAKENSSEELLEIIEENNIEIDNIKYTYDISLIKNEEEYISEEELTIKISGGDNAKTYEGLLVEIENKSISNIEYINCEESNIIFVSDKLDTFVILEYESIVVNKLAAAPALTMMMVNPEEDADTIVPVTVEGGTIWNGSIATSFKFGSGTASDPYLIRNGEELAYLASQVNNGTTYAGVYFEQTNDINLNSLAWTPIGTITNSFRGIYDGSGRKISNVSIKITNTNNNVEAYGVFGSIGGGSSYCEIKNVEFNAVNIAMTVTRTIQSNNYGYKIGSVTGVMYNHSKISNVAVKNSTITHSGTITARYSTGGFGRTATYYAPIVFVGGIAGDAVNTSSSETDPGNGARAIISNCYSDVDIGMNLTSSTNNYGGGSAQQRCFAQTNIGGIIGRIKSQNTWPTTCLYTGTISAQYAMIGPIFGAERNNTDFSTSDNMNTIWNGDNRSSLTMQSYYSSYKAYTSTFTSTVTTGNAGTNSTYRRSSTSTNIGYEQGVNKGIYLSNISNMVSTFNSNITTGYMTWEYKNGEICLKSRLTADTERTADSNYQINITDNYNVGSYTYQWYINDVLDTTLTGNTFSVLSNYEQDKDIIVLVSDGAYKTTAEFIVPRLYIEVSASINSTTNTAIAVLSRNRYTLC